MANQPNLFELSGDGIQITYSTTSLVGPPQFTYHDATQATTFMGDQIQVTPSSLGTLVSIVIHQTIDAGSTTFSLVLPRASLSLAPIGNITTVGITALHKMSIVGTPNGQSDFYTVHPLQGTASYVVF
jgi:hypothetical protein